MPVGFQHSKQAQTSACILLNFLVKMAMSASYGSLGFVEQVGSIYDWKNTIIIHQLPHNSVFTTGYSHTHTHHEQELRTGRAECKVLLWYSWVETYPQSAVGNTRYAITGTTLHDCGQIRTIYIPVASHIVVTKKTYR